MTGQTIILRGPRQRDLACDLIRRAPDGAIVNVREASRTTDQNARMWAMLSDVSRAKPEGRAHTPEVWKALFMHALGYEVRFLTGLNGEPFPVGLRSSRLSKQQMSELIDFIAAYGDQHGVEWSEECPYDFR
tara:strand:- start:173 stop:568 length:396 start_codon:yes stop_codon:yes gene_type:complete